MIVNCPFTILVLGSACIVGPFFAFLTLLTQKCPGLQRFSVFVKVNVLYMVLPRLYLEFCFGLLVSAMITFSDF